MPTLMKTVMPLDASMTRLDRSRTSGAITASIEIRRHRRLIRQVARSGCAFLALVSLYILPAAAEEVGRYIIKAGDVLKISVWRESELQLTGIVRPDGGLSVPLAGDIMAHGKTVEELRNLIGKRLSRYISDPVVSVSVEEVRGNTFYVLGRVEEPGEFVIRRPTDVMQALSMAGGFTTFAKLNDIKILRRENGKQIAIPFRYSEVAEGENLEQNILLKSGDVIVVP